MICKDHKRLQQLHSQHRHFLEVAHLLPTPQPCKTDLGWISALIKLCQFQFHYELIGELRNIFFSKPKLKIYFFTPVMLTVILDESRDKVRIRTLLFTVYDQVTVMISPAIGVWPTNITWVGFCPIFTFGSCYESLPWSPG